MEKKSEETPFIFYLTFEDSLPKNYYLFDTYLRELNFLLVPVKIDQLQILLNTSSQGHMIVISSTSDGRDFKLYNEKVRGLLKFLLKSKRLTFMHFSSFSRLSDQRLFMIQRNYFFIKYPINVKYLSEKIAKYYNLKTKTDLIWPGGRRAVLDPGV